MEERTGMGHSQSRHIVLSSRDRRHGIADTYKLHKCALDPVLSESHGDTRGSISNSSNSRSTRYAFSSRLFGKDSTIPTWYNYGALAAISIGVIMLTVLRLLWS